MIVKSFRLEPKLLAGAPPFSSAANKSVLVSLRVPETTAFSAIEEIHLRAETITPVLKEILANRPASRWGINE